jgi:hypothetical protein
MNKLIETMTKEIPEYSLHMDLSSIVEDMQIIANTGRTIILDPGEADIILDALEQAMRAALSYRNGKRPG